MVLSLLELECSNLRRVLFIDKRRFSNQTASGLVMVMITAGCFPVVEFELCYSQHVLHSALFRIHLWDFWDASEYHSACFGDYMSL